MPGPESQEHRRYRHFPETHETMTAEELYERVFLTLSSPRNEVYLSRPLSGGGKNDWLSDARKDLHFPQRMIATLEINEVVARVIASEIEHHFEEREIVLPPFLRLGEFGAIKFWMYFISGLDIDSAQRFGRLADGAINRRIFNDYQVKREERQREYQKLLRSFTGFISGLDCPTNPLPLMILLPGHQRSLSSSLEKELAVRLGIVVKEVVFDSKHPRFQDDILRRLIQPLIEENELFWGAIKDYRFSTPTIEGDGRNLVVLRNYQG